MCGIGGRVPEKLGTLGDLGHTLNRASFNVSTAEAAKSCSRGAIAAFGPGEFHRVSGRGSKILLPRRDCCLWSWRVSSGLRRRQQIHASLGYSAAFGHGSLGSKGRQPNEARLGNL